MSDLSAHVITMGVWRLAYRIKDEGTLSLIQNALVGQFRAVGDAYAETFGFESHVKGLVGAPTVLRTRS